jgi:GntR family transcriptional regulator
MKTGTIKSQIDRESPDKLYQQLITILRTKLDSDEWAVGTQIPTEEELCRVYEVSKATVRIAISELVRQGYLRRQQGKGTFVCKRVIPEGLAMLTSFRELMLDARVVFSTTVLAQTVMMVTDDLSIKLHVPDDRHLIYVKRVRSVAGEPVLLQESFLPHMLCPLLLDADLEKESLLELLENRCNVKITRVRDFIEVVSLAPEEAAVLTLPPGSPALLLEQFFYSGDTQVMYTRSLKRPERFRLVIDLERKP